MGTGFIEPVLPTDSVVSPLTVATWQQSWSLTEVYLAGLVTPSQFVFRRFL